MKNTVNLDDTITLRERLVTMTYMREKDKGRTPTASEAVAHAMILESYIKGELEKK